MWSFGLSLFRSLGDAAGTVSFSRDGEILHDVRDSKLLGMSIASNNFKTGMFSWTSTNMYLIFVMAPMSNC